jgi:hypothetical protein
MSYVKSTSIPAPGKGFEKPDDPQSAAFALFPYVDSETKNAGRVLFDSHRRQVDVLRPDPAQTGGILFA